VSEVNPISNLSDVSPVEGVDLPVSPSHQVVRLTAELQAAHGELLRQQQWIGQLEEQVAILQSRLESLHVGNREAYIAELQEQVLQQASQAAEREAAIQYWKEQALKHQRQALQLSAALERVLAEREHPIETPPPKTPSAPSTSGVPGSKSGPKPSIALPGFLGRRSLATET